MVMVGLRTRGIGLHGSNQSVTCIDMLGGGCTSDFVEVGWIAGGVGWSGLRDSLPCLVIGIGGGSSVMSGSEAIVVVPGVCDTSCTGEVAVGVVCV